MKILLTNDDAYYAEGINELRKALVRKRSWRIMTVAPSREQSAASHSLTLNNPLRITTVDQDRYVIDGTPADCVLLAVHALKGKKPDLVISGINHGPNLGEDIIYSGTVAAAREAALSGIAAVAVSLTDGQPSRFGYAAKFIRGLAAVIARHGLPQGIFLNVNIPNVPESRIRGAVVTTLGRRTYRNLLEKRTDPRGNDYYWIAGTPVWDRAEGTDYDAVRRNRISVTPLSTDLAYPGPLDSIEKLLKNCSVN